MAQKNIIQHSLLAVLNIREGGRAGDTSEIGKVICFKGKKD
jgi:hypothetical protein